jgi:hypothetical protein
MILMKMLNLMMIIHGVLEAELRSRIFAPEFEIEIEVSSEGPGGGVGM